MTKIEMEIMDAFADCNRHWDLGSRIRNLNFKAVETLPLVTLAKILPRAIPGGYNHFDAHKVIALLKQAKAYLLYRVAREGSPALYVYGSPEELNKVKNLPLEADEIDFVEKECLRLWWD